ncbi:MAG: hypothetical protein WBP74_08305 [Nitrososphaeraceae archaeon]
MDVIRVEVQKGLEAEGNKQTLLDQKMDPSKPGSLPTIAIYDTGFSFEKTGIGEAMGVTREQTQDEFSGDGIKTKFKLRNSTVRPLISVEVPANNKLTETTEYTVDYLKNEVTFRTPPPKVQKGKNNIFVTYSLAKSAGEVKGIRVKVHCNFDIWAKTSAQCDKLALGVVRSMLFAEDTLSIKGIHLTPLGGTTISDTDGGKIKDLFARRLNYRVEKDISFAEKVPRIETIEISKSKV